MNRDNDKGKKRILSVLKKKQSSNNMSDESEKKPKKEKKSKQNREQSAIDEQTKRSRASTIVRKLRFGKSLTSMASSSGIRRASSSNSVTGDIVSDNSDNLSTSVSERHTPEGGGTPLQEENNMDECIEKGADDKGGTEGGTEWGTEGGIEWGTKGGTEKNTEADTKWGTKGVTVGGTKKEEEGGTKKGAEGGTETPHQPVSVTPYAISSWKTSDTLLKHSDENIADELINADGDKETLMEKKLDEEGNSAENNKVQSANVKDSTDTVHANESSTSATFRVGVQEVLDNSKIGEEVVASTSKFSTMPAFGNLIMDGTKDRPDIMSCDSSLERKEYLYKILVIGELGTGKTSIIKRYVHQFFSQHYRATIGVDFALKVLTWDANTIIRLQLWDIAGQERFGNMTRVYYKDAVGAFIVFDVTRVATFEAVDKWKQDLDTKVQLPDGSSIPCVLLGNKCDQPKEGPINTPAKMDEYCTEKGFSGWFETSAKNNIHIDEAAKFLVTKILQNEKLLHGNEENEDIDKIAIGSKGEANEKSKSCTC